MILAFMLLGVATGGLALIFPDAALTALQQVRGRSAEAARHAQDWLGTGWNTALHWAGSMAGSDAAPEPDEATSPGLRIVNRAVGTLLLSAVALVALAADAGLAVLTVATMLQMPLPEDADLRALHLMAAATVSSVFFWSMVALDGLGWAPRGFMVWPRTGRWARAFWVLTSVMTVASIALVVTAAVYRDQVLVLNVVGPAGGEVDSGVSFEDLLGNQRHFLVLLAVVATITAGVASTVIPRLVKLLAALVCLLAGLAVKLVQLAVTMLGGLVDTAWSACEVFLKAVVSHRDEVRRRREELRRQREALHRQREEFRRGRDTRRRWHDEPRHGSARRMSRWFI